MTAKKAATITPLMKQYLEIKEENKNAILFFRMGDFYEMFHDDAIIASKILGISLTSRDKNSANPVPLCGIPYHAIDIYLSKMIKAGQRVAICEQVEDPKTAKGIVKREVVRTVSPGTVIDSTQITSPDSNNIVTVARQGKKIGIAVIELTTGEFYGCEFFETSRSAILDFLGQQPFTEIVITNDMLIYANGLLTEVNKEKVCITTTDDWYFDKNLTGKILQEHFGVLSLDGYGISGKKALILAGGGLLNYLRDTQQSELKHIEKIKVIESGSFMTLDFATIRNLEIVANSADGSKEGTLLAVLDKCKTPMGKRNLREWIIRPLVDKKNIEDRLSVVSFFYGDVNLGKELSQIFKNIGDIERIAGRIALGNANARDLVSLKESLKTFPLIHKLLSREKVGAVASLIEEWNSLEDVVDLIEAGIVDDPPFTIREGNIVKPTFHEKLEELDSLTRDNKNWLQEFEANLRTETGIPTLKVGYNKVYGFFIEVTKKNTHLVPANFIRKQSLVNNERFINEELKGFEEKILTAEDKKKELEYRLFIDIISKVDAKRSEMNFMAKKIALLDTLLSFAVVAEDNRYCEPSIKEERELLIEDGRHPVIEQNIEGIFISNNLELNDVDRQLAVITGPNMAGKSTYLRQAALITLMAQIGCYVPAKKAEIGIVDRIFTRVGAQDNLYRGQSTFMVEMNEAANILNNATGRSLVILDEIGRGTSTFDGLSIAWSIVEHILTNEKLKCRTLFATHYHELTAIETLYKGVVNMLVKVDEYEDTISFTHEVADGKADKSYGIHVAKLAGVPKAVVKRAEEILEEIENGNVDQYGLPKIDMRAVKRVKQQESLQMPSLFEDRQQKAKNKYKEIIQEVKDLDLDELSPRDSLNLLYAIRKKIEDKDKEKE